MGDQLTESLISFGHGYIDIHAALVLYHLRVLRLAQWLRA